MDSNAKAQYRALYLKMFEQLHSGNRDAANKFRVEMEAVRRAYTANRKMMLQVSSSLPPFVSLTLNRRQADLGISEASNCINAAFNFHKADPIWRPFSTMDFLSEIRSSFSQIQNQDELIAGDLIVFWSRAGNRWGDRKILVEKIDPEDPEFPFGLVFDHVAVYLGEKQLFHKPDPTPESPYQINLWEDVVAFNEMLPGFELTFHRKLE